MTEPLDKQGRPIPGSAPPTPDGFSELENRICDGARIAWETGRTGSDSFMRPMLKSAIADVRELFEERDELLRRLEAAEQRADAAERERDEALAAQAEVVRLKAQVITTDPIDYPKPRCWDER